MADFEKQINSILLFAGWPTNVTDVGNVRIGHLQMTFFVSRLDLMGIVAGTQGPWYPWMYYTFYCDTTLRVSIFIPASTHSHVKNIFSLSCNDLLNSEAVLYIPGLIDV